MRFLYFLCVISVFGNPDSSRIQLLDDKEVKILWYTTSNEISRVFYMPVRFGLKVADLIDEGFEENESPEDLGGLWEHTVKLNELTAGQQYAYICGNGDHGWSGINTFTAPRNTQSPRLAVLGTLYDSAPSSAALSSLYASNLIEPLDIIVYFAFGATEATPQLQTLQGNIPTLYVPYTDREKCYSIGFNDIYLIFLNTESLGPDEINWLGDELYESRNYSWVFVFGNNPTPPTTVDLA